MTGAEGEKLQQIADDVASIKVILTGNGHPETGVIVRLDRLEQNETRRHGLWMVGIGTAFAALATAIVEMFRH